MYLANSQVKSSYLEGMVRQIMTQTGTKNPKCLGNVNLALCISGADVLLEDVVPSSPKSAWLTLPKTTFKNYSPVTTTTAIATKGPQAVPGAESSQKAIARGKETHRNKPKRVPERRRRGLPPWTSHTHTHIQQRPQDGDCATDPTVDWEKPSTWGPKKEPGRVMTAPEKRH